MTTYKVLVIGDPHFKSDNTTETDLMTTQLRALIIEEKIDLVVVAGDVLHKFEKIDLYSLKRATEFLKVIHDVSKRLIILVGNHDRPNNNVYLTDEHGFNALKEWTRTTVVDNVQIHDEIMGRFVYIPYVPTGRFGEALATKNLKPPYTGITTIFAHQEFKGAKMNAITSNEGDTWALENPLCVSGHIHDFDVLQPNLIYVGTPLQHGYADTSDKTVSIFHYSLKPADTLPLPGENKEASPVRSTMVKHQRVSLKIPKHIQVTLTPEELATYVVPPLTHVKIKVRGDPTVIKEIMKLDHVIKLIQTHGVKIVAVDTNVSVQADLLALPTEAPKVKVSFQNRVLDAVKAQTPGIQTAFKHLFAM